MGKPIAFGKPFSRSLSSAADLKAEMTVCIRKKLPQLKIRNVEDIPAFMSLAFHLWTNFEHPLIRALLQSSFDADPTAS